MKSPKIIHRCIACASTLQAPLMVLDNMPCGAQSMPERDRLEEDCGVKLPLCRCPVCGLVQLDCEPVDYYRDAIRVVGLSETMRSLRRADYTRLISAYGLAGKKWLELGCGNGDFLDVLSEFPVRIYGTEYGEPNLSEARARLPGARIMQFFPEEPDMEIPGAPFDCFLSFNFLEHQPDPGTMLRCAHRNLAAGGVGLITVPSFEYIINNGRYYELIRDHIANYTLGSLEDLCERCGFRVLEKAFIGIGDTIRVIVRKEDSSEADRIRRLSEDYKRTRSEIEGFTGRLANEGRSLALWGAGHQCFTVAATTALKDYARYIIDSSDKKQGRYAPSSHLLIVHPDWFLRDPVDVIMITAPGYVREIEGNIRKRYGGVTGKPAICDLIDLNER